MKTTVGKVLSVAIAVASVIFMGFVLVATLGGPNWEAEAHSIDGYTFGKTDAQPIQWTASRHVGDKSMSPSKTIEQVMVAVYDDKIQETRTQVQKFEQQEGPLQAQIAEAKAAIDADEAALTKQIDDLAALLNATEANVQQTAQQVEAKAEEVRKVELRIQSRREDVLRLSAQVEEIRADRYRIHEVQQQLQDLIQQIDGNIERAQRRQAQLQGATDMAGQSDSAPADRS
ncbi:MAG: hypothetical protein JNG89_19065 [Planctomycetaceae bacterium]|nr:hypothetical protein [Planctomycetaceae bacterium]